MWCSALAAASRPSRLPTPELACLFRISDITTRGHGVPGSFGARPDEVNWQDQRIGPTWAHTARCTGHFDQEVDRCQSSGLIGAPASCMPHRSVLNYIKIVCAICRRRKPPWQPTHPHACIPPCILSTLSHDRRGVGAAPTTRTHTPLLLLVRYHLHQPNLITVQQQQPPP